jgi:hypothetical protein
MRDVLSTYWDILYPNSNIPIHNPDNDESPLHQYLVKCAEYGGGVFDEKNVAVKSYDFKTKSFSRIEISINSGN